MSFICKRLLNEDYEMYQKSININCSNDRLKYFKDIFFIYLNIFKLLYKLIVQ